MGKKSTRQKFWRRERRKLKANLYRSPKSNPRKVGHGPN